MIYLDTSAFIKLYILEKGSAEVSGVVTSQDNPLPVWSILEAELTNALRLKVCWKDLDANQADQLLAQFRARKLKGQYYQLVLNQQDLMACFIDLTHHTPELGCRTLDIFHVAAALLIGAGAFISYDERQIALATSAGLHVPRF